MTASPAQLRFSGKFIPCGPCFTSVEDILSKSFVEITFIQIRKNHILSSNLSGQPTTQLGIFIEDDTTRIGEKTFGFLFGLEKFLIS
jgi:hypothetical protein